MAMAIALCSALPSFAQKEIGYQFGKISPEDFDTKKFTVPGTEGGLIVFDVGKSWFEGNNKGWFSLIYEVKRRVYITDKKGFDLASVSIPLYFSMKDNAEEKLEDLKAVTYNLENGKVVSTKLDKDQVFKEKVNSQQIIRKFTMPAVKEGSIIEYTYRVNSDYLFNLQPWAFQSAFPNMYSRYEVSIPEFFSYVFLSQGYTPITDHSKSDKTQSYTLRERKSEGPYGLTTNDEYTLTGTVTTNAWLMKNVPGMKEETFTSSINNHLSKIEFQLAGYSFPNSAYQPVMETWELLGKKLNESEDFGAALGKDREWISDNTMNITTKTDQLQYAKAIYAYVRNNFKSKGIGNIWLSQSLRNTISTHTGNASDINLLLTHILRGKGMDAVPVILSTRGNGRVNDVYPLINQYNYVITLLTMGTETYLLDASLPYLGFDRLPRYAYNGTARIIVPNETPRTIVLDPLNNIEEKTTVVELKPDGANLGKLTGTYESVLGYNESADVRNTIMTGGRDAFIKKITEGATGDMMISNVKIDQLDQYELPVKISYTLSSDYGTDKNLLYLNPMLHEAMKENQFKSQQRLYPVEIPYRVKEKYTLHLVLPTGFAIDEVPKSVNANYNDTEGKFMYIFTKNEKEITLKSDFEINKAIFGSDEYEDLRNYFDYLVKVQAEQIVLKKK
jgi:hypothetical protein